MDLEIKEAVPMHAICILARDDAGKELMYMRYFMRDDALDGGFAWLTSEPGAHVWAQVPKEECLRLDEALGGKLAEYVTNLKKQEEAQ